MVRTKGQRKHAQKRREAKKLRKLCHYATIVQLNRPCNCLRCGFHITKYDPAVDVTIATFEVKWLCLRCGRKAVETCLKTSWNIYGIHGGADEMRAKILRIADEWIASNLGRLNALLVANRFMALGQ